MGLVLNWRRLLYITHQVVERCFFHRVLSRLGITAGNCQYVPVLVIQLHYITAVVVTRPTYLLAEQGVVKDRFRSQETMLQLPCTQ